MVLPGCYLSLDSGEVAFSKNGAHLGKAFSIPPNDRDLGWHERRLPTPAPHTLTPSRALTPSHPRAPHARSTPG